MTVPRTDLALEAADDLAARAAEYPVERVAEITWVQSEAILAAARTIATAKPVSFM